MRVVCAWCQAEGRPGALGEKPPLDEPGETHGICWQHRIRLLAGNPLLEDSRFLVVVARSRPDILAEARQQFADDPRIQVVADRRHGERRRGGGAYWPERRRGDRRTAEDEPDRFPSDPVLVVRTTERLAPVVPPRHQIEHWLRDSQTLLTRIIPSLFEECDGLRRRAEQAEETSRRLGREARELEGEVGRLRSEVERLQRERAAMAGYVQSRMAEVNRLAGELLVKLG